MNIFLHLRVKGRLSGYYVDKLRLLGEWLGGLLTTLGPNFSFILLFPTLGFLITKLWLPCALPQH